MNYVNGDYDKMGNFLTDAFNALTGGKSVSDVISNLAYDEAMKQVGKNADIVKSFASKAVAAANSITAQLPKMAAAPDQATADAVLNEAKRLEAVARNEATNAAKNFAATQASMKALLSIKGLPKAVTDGANTIITSAQKSLDTANSAATRATQALATVQSAHTSKYGSFFANLTNFPGLSSITQGPYGTYLMIGGSVIAVSLVGLIAYKLIKRKQPASAT
jgi:hypothetical protein